MFQHGAKARDRETRVNVKGSLINLTAINMPVTRKEAEPTRDTNVIVRVITNLCKSPCCRADNTFQGTLDTFVLRWYNAVSTFAGGGNYLKGRRTIENQGALSNRSTAFYGMLESFGFCFTDEAERGKNGKLLATSASKRSHAYHQRRSTFN